MPNTMYIVKALNGKKEGLDWRCECPVHDNGTHLIITDKRGKFQMNCMMGAKYDELVAALTSRNLWQENGHYQPAPKQTGTTVSRPKQHVEDYVYRRRDGTIAATKGRFVDSNGKKTFLWKMPNANDWHGFPEGYGERLPLYGEELVGTGDVWFVEGEKAANACRDRGMVAVCWYQGAGKNKVPTREVLSVLAGANVILWPDNDAPGRALMVSIMAALQGIAQHVRMIQPDVPEKGDAYDYFEAGGTTEALHALPDAIPDEPIPEFLVEPSVEETPEGLMVKLPYTIGGVAWFRFDNIEEKSHELLADITVGLDSPGQPRKTFGARLNLLSLSARDTMRRSLDEVFGKGFWSGGLAEAVEMARRADSDRDWSLNLAGLQVPDGQSYVHFPLLPADGPTIWFGQGASGKTYCLLTLIVCGVMGVPFLGSPMNETPAIFVDYEATAAQIKRRVRKILVGLGLDAGLADMPEFWGEKFIYWPGKGRKFRTMIPALRRKIREAGAGYIVIDSGGLACGGNPKDEDAALDYMNELAKLTIPSLTICHVPKADENQHTPYGSVFWGNSARNTWNFQSATDDEGSEKRIGLFCRKINDDRLPKPLGAKLAFSETGVSVEQDSVAEGFDKEVSMATRIRRVLPRLQQATAVRLAAELGVDVGKVRVAITRMDDVIEVDRESTGKGRPETVWGLQERT